MNIEENVIKKMHPHPIGFLGYYFIGIVIVVIGALYYWQVIPVGLLIFILGEVFRRAETFYILESGVARGYHFLSTSRKFAEYGNIQNIEVNQSFFENILGIGSIKFDTSGSDIIEVAFHGVVHPYSIEKIVREKMALK